MTVQELMKNFIGIEKVSIITNNMIENLIDLIEVKKRFGVSVVREWFYTCNGNDLTILI